jgi:hypothetical protein
MKIENLISLMPENSSSDSDSTSEMALEPLAVRAFLIGLYSEMATSSGSEEESGEKGPPSRRGFVVVDFCADGGFGRIACGFG